jgi:hypothetical protein
MKLQSLGPPSRYLVCSYLILLIFVRVRGIPLLSKGSGLVPHIPKPNPGDNKRDEGDFEEIDEDLTQYAYDPSPRRHLSGGAMV